MNEDKQFFSFITYFKITYASQEKQEQINSNLKSAFDKLSTLILYLIKLNKLHSLR